MARLRSALEPPASPSMAARTWPDKRRSPWGAPFLLFGDDRLRAVVERGDHAVF